MQFTRNILKVYRRATPEQVERGMSWYNDAHNLARDIANGDVWCGAGVIAAFSPLTPWWRNLELAVDSLSSGVARTDTLSNSAKCAQRIIDGEHPLEVLRGDKTRAFCSNIATNGECDSVTVDVHAFSIAHGKPIPSSKIVLGKRLYREIAECYSRAAKREGLANSQMQAITWVAWREMHSVPAARLEV